MKNEAKILKTKLDKISIEFNLIGHGETELAIETQSRIFPPKEKDNKTALYHIEATIYSKSREGINISASANIVFEFNEIPEDYNEVGKELCLKKAQVQIFDKIGDIMETMGYKRFDINIPE